MNLKHIFFNNKHNKKTMNIRTNIDKRDSFLNKENFIGNIEKDYREYKVKNEIFGNV